jgi:hypothetical protein
MHATTTQSSEPCYKRSLTCKHSEHSLQCLIGWIVCQGRHTSELDHLCHQHCFPTARLACAHARTRHAHKQAHSTLGSCTPTSCHTAGGTRPGTGHTSTLRWRHAAPPLTRPALPQKPSLPQARRSWGSHTRSKATPTAPAGPPAILTRGWATATCGNSNPSRRALSPAPKQPAGRQAATHLHPDHAVRCGSRHHVRLHVPQRAHDVHPARAVLCALERAAPHRAQRACAI